MMTAAASKGASRKKTAREKTARKKTVRKKTPVGQTARKVSGDVDNCEACNDLHFVKSLRADRRAKRHGVGFKLCPACHEFIAAVKDDDYVWSCTRMHKVAQGRLKPGPDDVDDDDVDDDDDDEDEDDED